MPMELTRRELKAQARERMRETRPPFWLLTLVYILLTTGVSTLADLTGAAQFTFPPSSGDTLPLFLYLLILLYTTVMNFGYQIWALRVYRRQQVGYGTLIDGFSMAGRVLLMELYIFGCTLCWTLAFGTAAGLMLFMLGWLPPVLLVLLFYGAVFGITLWISYRYALAPFLLMDRPEAGAIAPVRESVAMMRGWKWEYFKLDFSFFGWYLLNFLLAAGVELIFAYPVLLELLQATEIDPAILINGLSLPWTAVLLSTLVQIPLSLWLSPYVSIAHAGFYETLIRQVPPPPPVWGSNGGPYDGPYNGPEL